MTPSLPPSCCTAGLLCKLCLALPGSGSNLAVISLILAVSDPVWRCFISLSHYLNLASIDCVAVFNTIWPCLALFSPVGLCLALWSTYF